MATLCDRPELLDLRGMVGPCGLEPQTSTVSRWRSSQLSYGPNDAESIS